MNVVLCGYHWSGCEALDLLLRRGANVFVFTHDGPAHVPSLAALCRQRDVPYSLEDVSESTLPFAPDVVSSIYYRRVIKPHVIDACGGRIFNLHPSLLPRYRGCSSLTWAMIHGAREVGFTYHYIDAGIDTGRIILQHALPVESFDTQGTLYARVMFEAMKRFDDAFELVAAGAPGTAQTGEPSYFGRGCPHDGQIDAAWSEEEVERFIRAMNHPPYPPARFGGREIRTMTDFHGINEGRRD